MPSYPYEVDPTAELSQHDSQEIQTQQQTQSTQQTQQVSQPAGPADAHLFGYLQPCSATSKLLRVDFWKMHPKYKIGRNTELNNVVFPGFKVSEYTPFDASFTPHEILWVVILTTYFDDVPCDHSNRQPPLRDYVGWTRHRLFSYRQRSVQ